MKAQTYWVAKSPDGWFITCTMHTNKRCARRDAVSLESFGGDAPTWRQMSTKGWHIVKIEIREVSKTTKEVD